MCKRLIIINNNAFVLIINAHFADNSAEWDRT